MVGTVSAYHLQTETRRYHEEKQASLALTDLSPPPSVAKQQRRIVQFLRLAVRGLTPLLLLGLWQMAAFAGWTSPDTLPSPANILSAFADLLSDGELQAAVPASIARASVGLFLGGTVGLALGLFSGLWRIGEELFDAPMQMLRTVPFIALVPLFIIWFGIDEDAKIALITAASIFPVYLNTYAGVRGVDHKLIEAAQVFSLSGRKIAITVILPTALPSILIGIRFSAGVSLLALVAAEQINARSGIGYILMNANQNQRADIIIAGVLVYAVLGILTDFIMRFVEWRALPWRPHVVFA